MEFLYKLYDQKYFGIGLFIAIAFLIFLFLVILFFGKKDEKEKLEETKKLELANLENYKEADDNTKEIPVPEIEQPIIKEEIENTKVEEEIPEIIKEEPINTEIEEKQENLQENVIDIDELFKPNDNEISETDNQLNNIQEEKVETEQIDTSDKFEMPKLKTEEQTKADNNNNNIFDETVKINNIFDNIENESYNIK